MKTYGRSNNYWRFLQNHSLIHPNTILKWSHLHSNRFPWTSKPYSRAANKFYCFSAVFDMFFSNLEKYIGVYMHSRNSEDCKEIQQIYSISIKCYFSNMYSPKPRGKWQWQHLVREAFKKFKNQQDILIYYTRTVNFCPNIWILSRDPVP